MPIESASSCRLAALRANTRFAAFAHAMSNTAIEEMSSNHAARRELWICRSRMLRTSRRKVLRNGGGADSTKSRNKG